MKRGFSPVSFLAAAVLLVCAGLWFSSSGPRKAKRAALRQRELATRVLAEYIAEQYPKRAVLVVSNPFAQVKGRDPDIYSFEKAGISGLKRGFSEGTTVRVATPELRAEAIADPTTVYVAPRTKTPLSFLVLENSFDQLAKQFPECEIITSLIGLPLRFQQSEIWKDPHGPKLALLLPDWRILGEMQSVRTAFRSGKIIAAVVENRANPANPTPLSSDYREAFRQHFVLVTPDNILELSQKRPELF